MKSTWKSKYNLAKAQNWKIYNWLASLNIDKIYNKLQ